MSDLEAPGWRHVNVPLGKTPLGRFSFTITVMAEASVSDATPSQIAAYLSAEARPVTVLWAGFSYQGIITGCGGWEASPERQRVVYDLDVDVRTTPDYPPPHGKPVPALPDRAVAVLSYVAVMTAQSAAPAAIILDQIELTEALS